MTTKFVIMALVLGESVVNPIRPVSAIRPFASMETCEKIAEFLQKARDEQEPKRAVKYYCTPCVEPSPFAEGLALFWGRKIGCGGRDAPT